MLDFTREAPTEPSTPEEALARFGLRTYRAFGSRVIVYVPPPPSVTPNGVLLTTRESWTLRGLPHLYLVTRALVVAVGPRVTDIRPGDRIFFPRTNFGWLQNVDRREYLGYIERRYIAGRHTAGRPTAGRYADEPSD